MHELRDALQDAGDSCVTLSAFAGCADTSSELHVLHDGDRREDRMNRYRSHVDDAVAREDPGVRAILERVAPDVLHTNNLFGLSTAIWSTARRLGIPVVHTVHDYGLLCPRTTLTRRGGAPCRPSPRLCGWRTRRLARWAPAVAGVVGVSQHVLDAHSGFFHSSTDTYVVLAPRVPSAGPPPTRLGDHLSVLGFVGRLDEHKGVGELLRAAPALARLGVRVRVAGGGPMESTVADAKAVDYVGHLVGDELSAFLASCDAGVVPSRWAEPGITFAALEWLAAGRPVLATARGGLAELDDPAVVRITGTPEDLARCVAEVRAGQAWERLRSAATPTKDDRDLVRWRDEHRRIYAAARVHPVPPAV